MKIIKCPHCGKEISEDTHKTTLNYIEASDKIEMYYADNDRDEWLRNNGRG